MDDQIIQIIDELKKVLSELDVRAINESTESNRVTIVLVDRKESLIVEIKDDTKDSVYEAAGLPLYSNSNQLFHHILPYLKLFGSKASHLFEFNAITVTALR